MRNLFLLGSPRENGNSETMAKAVAEGLAQMAGNSVEFIHLNDLQIRPCQSCGGCTASGNCIIKDDMEELYLKTDEADRLFFVSPIYFYALSAQLKSYIDRCQARWARKYLLGRKYRAEEKRGGYLLSCASTNGKKLFEGPVLTIKCLCDTLDLEYGEPLLIRNVESRKALLKLPEEMAKCKQYGSDIAKSHRLS